MIKISSVVKFLLVAVVFASAWSVSAVAIDDSITPQNCDRTDPSCAYFMDTTSNGQVKWGGFIAGGLRSLTNLFVDGKLGVGTLRPSTGEKVLKLDVEGAVGAKFYCDENGNHCVAGDSLGGNSTTTTGSISLTTNGGGLIFSPTTITNTGSISLDTTFIQKRVGGVCSGSQAIKQINQDGTVVCQAVSGSTNPVSLTAGNGIVVSPSPITSSGVISIDPEKTQSRVVGSCPTNSAIRVIAQNGTVTCQPITVGGGTTIPAGGINQTLRYSGNDTLSASDFLINTGSKIGIGVTNPESVLHVRGTGANEAVIIETNNGTPFLILKDKASNTQTATYNWQGNMYTEVENNGLISFRDHRKESIPERMIISSTGVSIGTNQIDPAVRLNVAGSLKLVDGTQGAGKTLVSDAGGKASWKSCSVCISAYDWESQTWSPYVCSSNGVESPATGFDGSKSIEKVKVKMQCN